MCEELCHLQSNITVIVVTGQCVVSQSWRSCCKMFDSSSYELDVHLILFPQICITVFVPVAGYL